MFTYFKMKKIEFEIKLALYKGLKTIIDNQKSFSEFAIKLYTSLKDVPTNQLKEELVSKIAELTHEQAVKERAGETN